MKYKSRRFDFLPKEVYDSLPKKDLDRLDRYREQYRKVVLREGKIQRDENKLIKLKEELKDMKSDLVHSGNTMDYLRNNFSFSVSISPLKPRGKTNRVYYNLSINRVGTNKSVSMSGEKQIMNLLTDYYKGNKTKLKKLKSNWKEFLKEETNLKKDKDGNVIGYGEIYLRILKLIIKYGDNIEINRYTLFPITPPKSKGVSIPIMITNKMRIELSTLGYSRDEMKHLTPIESHEIINKGVPKKPSVDRSRSQ